MKLKLLIFATTLLAVSHTNAQTWRSKKSYPNTNGSIQSCNFVVSDKLYILGGYGSTGFYEYTPGTDSWKNKGNLPYPHAHDYTGGVAFTLNGKGYICAGEDGPDKLTNVWEYDDVGNKWTKKSPYPGAGVIYPIAFTLNGKAYVGCGGDGLVPQKDFYEYDPATDKWTRKADCPQTGFDNQTSFVFSINNKGYVSISDNAGTRTKDTYEYDPAMDKWTQKTAFPGNERINGTAYVYNNIAYCGLGGKPFDKLRYKDMFTYNAATDTWKQDADFAGGERANGIAVNINGFIYCGLGTNSSAANISDWWEYSLFPAGITSQTSNTPLVVYPSPATDKLYISLPAPYKGIPLKYQLYNSIGQLVQQDAVSGNAISINRYAPGIYSLAVTAGNEQWIKQVTIK